MPRTGRPKKTGPDSLADAGITIRLTADDRALLAALVRHRQDELGPDVMITQGSFIRGLIRERAKALGIVATKARGKAR